MGSAHDVPGESMSESSADAVAAAAGVGCAVSIDDHGTVRLVWDRSMTITEGAAELAMAAVNEVCGQTTRSMLVDMSTTAAVERKARAVFGRPCQASRIALLGRSPVDRVIANFVLGVSTQPCPTRFFTSETDAAAWLASRAE